MAKERESKEERKKKGCLKTRHKKSKISRKPKRHMSGVLTPLVRMCHVTTMCTMLPLRIKCGTKPQKSCLDKKPFIFWWSSRHVKTTTEPGGATDRPNEPPCPDEPIKHLHPPLHLMDEGRQAINRGFNTSDSYKLVVRQLEAHQKPH